MLASSLAVMVRHDTPQKRTTTMNDSKQPTPITITLHVDAATAVREGHCTAGPHQLRLTQTDLAALDPDLREALALHLAGPRRESSHKWIGPAVQWADPLTRHAPPIGKADVATLVALLRHRIAAIVLDDERIAREIEAYEAEMSERASTAARAFGELCDAWSRGPIDGLIRMRGGEWEPSRDHYHADSDMIALIRSAIDKHGTVAAIVSRESEAIAECKRRNAAAVDAVRASRETVAKALECVALLDLDEAPQGDHDGALALAQLYRDDRAVAAEVESMLRCYVDELVPPHDLDPPFVDDPALRLLDRHEPTSIPVRAAMRLAAVAKLAAKLPEALQANASLGWAYRAASKGEDADCDGEIRVQIVGIWCTVGDVCVAIGQEIDA